MRPVIGVMPLVDEDKDSLWMLPGYLNGVLEAGGIPVIFPLINDVDIIRQMFSSVQGILLAGGHDVAPALYGEEPSPECGKSNPERDFMERIILDLALQNDIPVLGICRGIQFLNVFLGGTLYQDLPSQHPSKIEHHQMPPYSKPIHRVKIKSDCGLSEYPVSRFDYGILLGEYVMAKYNGQVMDKKVSDLAFKKEFISFKNDCFRTSVIADCIEEITRMV